MSNLPELTNANFEETVQDGVTMIDFWGQACGPCIKIAPIIDELAAECEGMATIVKVIVEDEVDIVTRFNVSVVPTLILIKNGQEVQRFIGITSKATLAEAIALACA